jgi:hypothetical protein
MQGAVLALVVGQQNTNLSTLDPVQRLDISGV